MKLISCSVLFFLVGCAGIPDGIEAVRGFEVDRYLGKWYEIARFDHSFERGLEQVTATYSMRDDGGIRVINRGFNPTEGEWKEAEGKAYFVGDEKTGRLKVSFFWFFYGGYNIIELDMENYSYALVCSNNFSYLWILARKPSLPDNILSQLVEKARNLGFNVDALIYVKHEEDK